MRRRRLASAAALLLLLAFIVVVAWLGTALGSAALDRSIVNAVVNLVLVVGIYLFIGLTGVFSFGQVGFVAVGAYTMALFTIPVETKEVVFREMPGFLASLSLGFWPALVLSGLIAAFLALLFAVPLSRMAGLTAALATLSILVIIYTVAGNWTQVTNGSQGMSGIPTETSLPVALCVALVLVSAIWLFQGSRTGLQIRATREDPEAAQAVGVRIGLYRGLAFVASAFVVGVGGGLYAALQGSITPEVFYLEPTFLLIAMLVVGGMTSLSGAVVGTVVLTALSEFLREVESGMTVGGVKIPSGAGMTEVGLAIVLLVVLAVRPKGILGGREFSIGWLATLRRRVVSARGPRDVERAGPSAPSRGALVTVEGGDGP
jgi:branched-chain amino acid transport system permease protein